MTCVFISEKSVGRGLCRSVGKMLSQHFGTVYVNKGRMRAPQEDAQLLVSDFQSFLTAKSDNNIFVFKDPMKIGFEPSKDGKTIAVVDSCNPKLMQMVSGTKLPAITCGLSPKDTITLSSIDVDTAVINLQRSITCFDGTEVEPQEIPVRLRTAKDHFALMATACIYIVCGNVQKLTSVPL